MEESGKEETRDEKSRWRFTNSSLPFLSLGCFFRRSSTSFASRYANEPRTTYTSHTGSQKTGEKPIPFSGILILFPSVLRPFCLLLLLLLLQPTPHARYVWSNKRLEITTTRAHLPSDEEDDCRRWNLNLPIDHQSQRHPCPELGFSVQQNETWKKSGWLVCCCLTWRIRCIMIWCKDKSDMRSSSHMFFP